MKDLPCKGQKNENIIYPSLLHHPLLYPTVITLEIFKRLMLKKNNLDVLPILFKEKWLTVLPLL